VRSAAALGALSLGALCSELPPSCRTVPQAACTGGGCEWAIVSRTGVCLSTAEAAWLQAKEDPPCLKEAADVSTLAGNLPGPSDGVGSAASLRWPIGITITDDGSTAFVADSSENKIRRVDLSTATVTTLAGSGYGSSDGVGTAAFFKNPAGIAVTANGRSVVVADQDNNKVRMIDILTGAVTTLAGSGAEGSSDGSGTSATFLYPRGVATTPDGAAVLVSDSGNHRLRRIQIDGAVVSTLAGQVSDEGIGIEGGYVDGIGSDARFSWPCAIVITPDGTSAFVADASNARVRRVDLSTASVTTLAGGGYGSSDGVGTAAFFKNPYGVSLTANGGSVVVADQNNNKVRMIDILTGAVTTLAGSGAEGSSDGSGTWATFKYPRGVATTPDGAAVLVSDSGNHKLRLIHLCLGCPVNTVLRMIDQGPLACDCEQGYTPLSSTGTCEACAPGSYKSSSGSHPCHPCAAGKYSTQLGASNGSLVCQPCAAGKHSSIAGADSSSACQDCAAGKFSTRIGASHAGTCEGCGEGKYSMASGVTTCLSCAAGKYSTQLGASTGMPCRECAAGKYSTQLGASSVTTCLSCAAGKYSTQLGASTGMPCRECASCISYFGNKSALSVSRNCPSCVWTGVDDQTDGKPEAAADAFELIVVSASIQIAEEDFDEQMIRDFERVIAYRVGVPTSRVTVTVQDDDSARFILCVYLVLAALAPGSYCACILCLQL